MKRTLCLLFFCFVHVAVHGRLTEKEDELIARFGEPTNRSEQRTSLEGRHYTVGEQLTFKSDQWTTSTLLIDSRCAQITYGKVGSWTDEQIIGLLERNGGSSTYKEEKTGLGKSYRTWKHRDGTVAMFRLNTLTLTHPLYDRHLATLKAKAQAASKRPPKF